MSSYAINDELGKRIEPVGFYETEPYKDGITPRRLPAWTRLQVPQVMDVLVRMPSGGRLRFATDSTKVGIRFHATNLVTPPAERRPISFSFETGSSVTHADSFGGNSVVLNRKDPTDIRIDRGEADTIYFDNLPAEMKTCELWLPHNAFLELRTLELNDAATLREPEKDSRPNWTHYGSSISHCMEADVPAFIWPAVAAREAGLRLNNLGFGGQCHLDQFVARTIRDTPADLISIKAGINIINADSMIERVFEPALHGFLDTIREGQPDTPIMLISAIFCPSAEDNPGPTVPGKDGKFKTIEGHELLRNGSMTLKQSRKVLERVVEVRTRAGDKNLRYLHGHELFSADDAGDLPDDLHPNPAGYIRMGERFAETVLQSFNFG